MPVPGQLFQPSVMHHSRLLGPLVSCDENEVPLILPYSQNLIFFVSYNWAQQATMPVPGWLFQPIEIECSSLVGPYVSCHEN